MGKILLLGNYLKKMYRSPARMILTTTGLILAVFLLMVGMIFSETFLASQLSVIKPYKTNNAVIVSGAVNFNIYDMLSSNCKQQTTLELYSDTFYPVKTIDNGIDSISVFSKAVRVNEGFNPHFMSDGESIHSRYSGELLFGRLFEYNDIENKANVTVIDENFAEILFGEKNSVGKIISFPVMRENEESKIFEIDHYEQYTVIGVVSGSDLTKKQKEDILTKKTELDGYTFNMYVPMSVMVGNKSNHDYTMAEIFTGGGLNYREFTTEINNKLMSGDSFNKYTITNYDNLYLSMYDSIKMTQQALMFLVLFLFLISGISIANTMFFSVKERINEIGIRKAIGAFDEDIIFQFLFEGVIYGLLGSVLGIFLAVFLSSHVFLLFKDSIFGSGVLIISWQAILLSFFASTLVGILASIFPAIYSAKIKVTDALRFD